jgi:hypothetical protein
MILAATLLASVAAIAASEIIGRGQVVYTRMLGLIISYGVCSIGAGYVLVHPGGGLVDVIAVVLSGVPIMAAWLGFRIHISNSITLEMAGLFEDGQTRTLAQVADDYDVEGHAARRVAILREGGYLTPDAAATVTDGPRSRAVLLLIRVLCGPQGPRAVAESLRRRDGGAQSAG